MKIFFEEKMKKLLIKALKNSFNMNEMDAIELAKTVEDIFNGEKEIEDMSIDKYTRSLFYELQREGLLKLRREELKENGKIMRKFYWSFDNKKIKEEAYKVFKEEEWKIYKDIPSSAWVAHITFT
jgi:hypothetical protein